MPRFFNRDLVSWLAQDWRVEIVRVPIAVADPGYLSDASTELAKGIEVIDAAIAAGIYVIVDWHAHHPYTTQAVEFFGTIARLYGDTPNIIYETWNEPGPDYEWSSSISNHHHRTLESVRIHAPSAPIVLGSPQLCLRVDIAAQLPLGHENIAYALHFYAASHREGLRNRVRHALSKGACIFVTEWGMGDATGDGVLDKDETHRWLNFLNAESIGHVNWSICDKEEACAALEPGANSKGGWPKSQLTKSGQFVRQYLRSRKLGRTSIDFHAVV